MALCHHARPEQDQELPGSSPATQGYHHRRRHRFGGSRASPTRARKADSLLCEILIAGFWVATAAPGLLSLVSCMRSLMMACLSTEPAGAPGRLSGKSCGNWLFCRSSRISSKLSNSLPGCNKKKKQPQTHSTRRCSPAVGVLLVPSQAPHNRYARTGFGCFLQEARCGGSSQSC